MPLFTYPVKPEGSLYEAYEAGAEEQSDCASCNLYVNIGHIPLSWNVSR